MAGHKAARHKATKHQAARCEAAEYEIHTVPERRRKKSGPKFGCTCKVVITLLFIQRVETQPIMITKEKLEPAAQMFAET